MNKLADAIDQVLTLQAASGKPLGIILAGHNGSGKSTMWKEHLSDRLQIPLVNADRMMLSILPEVSDLLNLPDWAVRLRDRDQAWMQVAQRGVEAFVAQAMVQRVPVAMETVFSHWQVDVDGIVHSKIDKIIQLQEAGYFVVLCFVGLTSSDLSIARVLTRVDEGGHAVDPAKLISRYPRTQKAIGKAREVADAAILIDNSLTQDLAFSVCRIQSGSTELFDVRAQGPVEPAILEWLEKVAPREF